MLCLISARAADDTQLYLHCCLNDTAAAVKWLEICFDDVSHWMATNRLNFGTEVISASDHVRVLAVTISSDLSLDKPFIGLLLAARTSDELDDP